MKVKIGEIIYDSEKEPIMIIFDKDDKDNISHMSNDSYKYCSFPGEEFSEFSEEYIINFMKIT